MMYGLSFIIFVLTLSVIFLPNGVRCLFTIPFGSRLYSSYCILYYFLPLFGCPSHIINVSLLLYIYEKAWKKNNMSGFQCNTMWPLSSVVYRCSSISDCGSAMPRQFSSDKRIAYSFVNNIFECFSAEAGARDEGRRCYATATGFDDLIVGALRN